MNGIYYQGEDIVLNIELYDNDNDINDMKYDFTNTRAELYLSRSDNKTITSTLTDSELVACKIISLRHMTLTIPSEKIKNLNGEIFVRVVLIDTTTNNTRSMTRLATRIEVSPLEQEK